MFDLPVVEPDERKAATAFRNALLDLGFSMAQYSVYMRLLNGYDAQEAMQRKLEKILPAYGKVISLTVTDKQYERMHIFTGKRREDAEKPSQLTLF